jgi:hypothetical protein
MVHLPALNTPQFGWVRTRLPNHPQPVPPIYQPEVAARGILWAAQRHPRSLLVGAPTVLTILGQKFIPGLLDHYLAKNAVKDQQTDKPIGDDWQDNLDKPVDGDTDRGTHGIFDDRAHDTSPQLWATTHKPQLAASAGAVLGLVALALKRR